MMCQRLTVTGVKLGPSIATQAYHCISFYCLFSRNEIGPMIYFGFRFKGLNSLNNHTRSCHHYCVQKSRNLGKIIQTNPCMSTCTKMYS
jgi:hypothetical protein